MRGVFHELGVYLTIRMGGTAIIMEHFDPEQYLALVERHRVTHSQVVPTMFSRMLKLPPDEVRRRHDVSSLEIAIHGAAPCPFPVKEQMIEWWGPIIHEYYAATEGHCLVVCDSTEWLAHRGTVGRVLAGELHVLDEDLHPVPEGMPGTLWRGAGCVQPSDRWLGDGKVSADGKLVLDQLIETVETLRVRGIGFRSLTEALDTTTAQGRLVFHMFGALAEFERSLIRERTQAGLAAARRAGRTGGRPPKLTDDDIEAAKAMLANPDIGVTQIAHRLGVSPATLYRYIPAARTANTPGV